MEYRIPFLWDSDADIFISGDGVSGTFSQWYIWWNLLRRHGRPHTIDEAISVMHYYIRSPGRRFTIMRFPAISPQATKELSDYIRREHAIIDSLGS
jgi:hypothetical protein